MNLQARTTNKQGKSKLQSLFLNIQRKSMWLYKEPEKDVVDLFADKSSQAQKFSVNPVQYCFEEIPFAGIFAIE